MLIDSEPNVNPPLIKHFTEKFKNLLSMITTLKVMKVIPIDLSFPKIIVLGDASVGKTSIISTLVGLSLPRVALDIPFVLKFEKYFMPYTKFYLRYRNQDGYVKDEVSEADLGARILAAVRLVPQDDKLDSSIEVIIMQPYVSDLTVIDLPGVRPYSNKDRQKEEFDDIRGYHLKHAKGNECVYLHVNHKYNTITNVPVTILSIVGSSELSLYKLFICDEYGKYEEEARMHLYPRLVEILKEFSSDLQKFDVNNERLFLEDEIELLDAASNGFCLDGFVSLSRLTSLMRKQISNASNTIGAYFARVWRYFEFVVVNVLFDHAKYNQLNSSLKTSASKMIDKMRENFVKKMLELLESEKKFFHRSNPGVPSSWEKYKLVKLNLIDLEKEVVTLEGLGDIKVGHLKKYSEKRWQQAFKLKMVMAAYWEALVKRFVDNFSVNLMSSITEMVDGGMQVMMTEHFNKRGEENDKTLLKESPMESLINNDCLKQRIEYLVQAKKEIEKLQQELKCLVR